MMSSPRVQSDERAVTATLATNEALKPQETDQEASHLVDPSQDPFNTPLTECSIPHSTNASPASYYQAQHLGSHHHYTPGSQIVLNSSSMPQPLIRHNSSHLHAATTASLLPSPASTSNRETSSATALHHQPRHLRFEQIAIETQPMDDDTHMSVSEASFRHPNPISGSSQASSLGSTVKRQKIRDARINIASSSNGRRMNEAMAVVGPNRKLKQRATKACDKCRDQKCKCVADPQNPRGACTQCSMLNTPCTFEGPSLKRGPPKGYLAAVITRLEAMEDTILSKLSGAANDPRARQLLLELIGESTLSQVLSGRIEFGRRRNQGAKKGSGPYGITWHDSWWVKSSDVSLNGNLPANSRSLGSRFLEPVKGRAADHSITQSQVYSYDPSPSMSGGDYPSNRYYDDVAYASGSVSRSANSASERGLSSKGSTMSLVEATPYQLRHGSSPSFDWQTQSLRAAVGSISSGGDKLHPFQPSGRPASFPLRPLAGRKGLSNSLRSDSGDASDLAFVPLSEAEQYAVRDVGNAEQHMGQSVSLFSALSGRHKISHSHSRFHSNLWYISLRGENDGHVGKSPPMSDEKQQLSSDVLRGIEMYFTEIQPQLPVLSRSYYEKLKTKRLLGDRVGLLEDLELTMYECSRSPRNQLGLTGTHCVDDNKLPLLEAGESPCLLRVIGLVIKGFHLLRMDKCIDACSCIGAAVANAQAIGLHKKTESVSASALFDTDESLARKMAWSSCLFLDKTFMAMGFNSSIDVRFCEAVAANADDLEAAQSTNLSLDSDQSTALSSVRLSACLHRWATTMDDVVVTFYATKTPTRAAVDCCEEQLLALSNSLSQLIDEQNNGRPDTIADNSHHSPPLIAVRLLVHQACIQLHSRFDSPARQAASTQSATAIAALLEQAASNLDLPAWAIHSVFTAAAELIASFGRAITEEGRASILNHFISIKHTLQKHSTILPLAAHRLSLVEGVSLSKLAAHCEDGTCLDSLLPPTQPPCPRHIPAKDTATSMNRLSTCPFAESEPEPRRLLSLSMGPNPSIDTRMSLGCPNGSLYSSAPDVGLSDWGGSGHNGFAGSDAEEDALVKMQRVEKDELRSNAAQPSCSSQQHLLLPASSSLLRVSRGCNSDVARSLAFWDHLDRPHEDPSREQLTAAQHRLNQDVHGGIKLEEGRDVGSTADASTLYPLAAATVASEHPRREASISCNTYGSLAPDACHSSQTTSNEGSEALRAQARPKDTCSSLGAYSSFPPLVTERLGPSGPSLPSSLCNNWSATEEGTLPWTASTSSERVQSMSDVNNDSTGIHTSIGLGLGLKLGSAISADAGSSSLSSGAASFECTSVRGVPTTLFPGSCSHGESSSTLRRALDFRRPKDESDLDTRALAGTWKTVRTNSTTVASTRHATSVERSLARPAHQK